MSNGKIDAIYPINDTYYPRPSCYYMYTQDNASSTTLPPEFETGAYINGGKYSFPLPEVNVLTLPKGGDGNYHIVPI
ncbi:MAG: hypothetical protein G5703_10155 [Serratia symbiotica]|nr:hypothetical protein [Serratia symbiotica]